LVEGHFTPDISNNACRMINAVRQDGFGPVLAVVRERFPAKFRQQLRAQGVHLLELESLNKITDDDLFFLNAALMLGPDTYVLSNDAFREYTGCARVLRMPKNDSAIGAPPQTAFDKWMRTRTIRFQKYAQNAEEEEPAYTIPSMWQSQGNSRDGGYHLLVEFRFKQSVYCIRIQQQKR